MVYYEYIYLIVNGMVFRLNWINISYKNQDTPCRYGNIDVAADKQLCGTNVLQTESSPLGWL